MYQLLSHLGLLNYFPIVCGVVGVLHVISVTFIKGNSKPSTIILVCVGIFPIIIRAILHMLVVHYNLDIVTSVTLLFGLFSPTFKLSRPHPNIISDLFGKKIVMPMNDTSGGVGQGGNNTPATTSGFDTNNTPDAAAAPAAQLPGRVSGLYPNTSPLPAVDGSYVNRPVHMRTVAGWKYFLWGGFHTNGQSNGAVGRMLADHLLFLYNNRLYPSNTYFCEHMYDWLHDWSLAHNRDFYNRVFAGRANDQVRL